VELAKPGAARCAEAKPPPVFLTVRTIGKPADCNNTRHVEPLATGADPAVSSGKIEITLPDGTSVKARHDVGLMTVRGVMSVLGR
jgi:hypothetical protein